MEHQSSLRQVRIRKPREVQFLETLMQVPLPEICSHNHPRLDNRLLLSRTYSEHLRHRNQRVRFSLQHQLQQATYSPVHPQLSQLPQQLNRRNSRIRSAHLSPQHSKVVPPSVNLANSNSSRHPRACSFQHRKRRHNHPRPLKQLPEVSGEMRSNRRPFQ